MQAAQPVSAAAPLGAATPLRTPQPRYLALDAYRGFIMIMLVSGGFGLAALAEKNSAFTAIANQFEHMPWEWIAFWDLISSFQVYGGVAMAFAFAPHGTRSDEPRYFPARRLP